MSSSSTKAPLKRKNASQSTLSFGGAVKKVKRFAVTKSEFEASLDGKRVKVMVWQPANYDKKTTIGLHLAPGAGGQLDSKALCHLCPALAEQGILVMLHGHVQNSRVPPNVPMYIEVIRTCQQKYPCRILYLGGTSMGNRVAVTALNVMQPNLEQHSDTNIEGLLFFAYPLCPKGQPHKLAEREAPLIELSSHYRVGFISGRKDDFVTETMILGTKNKMRGKDVEIMWIDRGNHGLVNDTKKYSVKDEVVKRALTWLTTTK